jgi:hypothetical protein
MLVAVEGGVAEGAAVWLAGTGEEPSPAAAGAGSRARPVWQAARARISRKAESRAKWEDCVRRIERFES